MEITTATTVQRRLGLAIAAAALVLSLNSLISRQVYLDETILQSLFHLTVVPVIGVGLFGLLTALATGTLGQPAQVGLLFVVSCFAALQATGGNLTSAAALGASVVLAVEYRLLRQRKMGTMLALLLVYACFYAYGLYVNSAGKATVIVQSFVGVAIVAYMFYTIAAARLQELANRQAELEAMVEERTQNLQSEVDRRRLAEQDLRVTARRSTQLAADREVLLQALHHRSKNDLQLVSSIMSLKAAKGGDPSLKDLFRPIQNRVRAIALIHEQLDGSERYDQVSVTAYLKALLSHVQLSHSEYRVRIVPDIPEDAVINLEAAEHLGLLINELILISYMHSFDGLSSGRIDVRVEMGETVMVTISDDGKPLPETVDTNSPDDADLGIAAGLLESLGGTIQLQREPHTRWVLKMPGDVFAPGS